MSHDQDLPLVSTFKSASVDDDDIIIMYDHQYDYIVFFNIPMVEFIMVLLLSPDPYSIILDVIPIFLHPFWYIWWYITTLLVFDSNNNNNNNNSMV